MVKYIKDNNHLVDPVAKRLTSQISYTGNSTKSGGQIVDVLRQVISVFKEQYYAFSYKSHTAVMKQSQLVDFEKLTYVSRESIINISTHPEFLRKCEFNSGIEFDGEYYIPEKIVTSSSKKDLDNFENRTVIGFLQTIMQYLKSLKPELEAMGSKLSDPLNEDSVSSLELIRFETQENIQKIAKEIVSIELEFAVVYMNYCKILDLPKVVLKQMPPSTRVFENTQHYKEVYNVMRLWFSSSKLTILYDKIDMEIAKFSLMYEHYLLLKMLNYMLGEGWTLQEKDTLTYNTPNSRYVVNLLYCNLFVFKKGEVTRTVYYQPVINSYSYKHGIHLYRTVNETVNPNYTMFYTPDFVVKTVVGDKESYIIIDAKMSVIDAVI